MASAMAIAHCAEHLRGSVTVCDRSVPDFNHVQSMNALSYGGINEAYSQVAASSSTESLACSDAMRDRASEEASFYFDWKTSVVSCDPATPNIVFVLTDDQGPWALGAAGNTEIQTPSLDRLAESGLRASRFFCVSPVCSPARASLLTGQIPSSHGVHDWLDGTGIGPTAVDYLSGQPLFTDVLAQAGYRCGLSGKWHLGANDKPREGFVHWYAHQSGGGPYYDAPMIRNGQPEHVEEYLTYSLTADALDFVSAEAERDEPFFLAVNYTAPHTPWKDNHPLELTRLYEDCEFTSCPQEQPHPWQVEVDGHPAGGESDTRAALIGYFAAITGVDRGVGQILDLLADRDLLSSTLVIFSSDNGYNCGHHGIWGKGNATYPQNMYDNSVMVPAIFSQPGRIPAGRISDDLLSGYDIFRTILDYAGIEHPDQAKSPGRSFAGLLTGRTDWIAGDTVAVFDEYGPTRMIRTRDWKYVHRWPAGPDELYDLVGDPGEKRNLVSEPAMRGRVEEMRHEMSEWFDAFVLTDADGEQLPVRGGGQSGHCRQAGVFA